MHSGASAFNHVKHLSIWHNYGLKSIEMQSLLNKRRDFLCLDLVMTSQLLLGEKKPLNTDRKMQYRKFLSMVFK